MGTKPRMPLAVCVAAVFVSALLGCGGNSDNTTAEQPQVDHRFVSAEALLAYFNSLDDTKPTEIRALAELYYAENDVQEQHIRMYRHIATIQETQEALHQYFGEEELDRYFERLFGGPLPDAPQPNDRLKHPARVTEHSDGRAVATYVDSLGLQHKLHLVNIGERWWISGYTMQYESLVEEQMLDRLDEITRRRAEVKRQLLPRLLAGEFRTPEDYYSLEHRLLEQ